MNAVREAALLIQSSPKISVVLHRHPDGDAIGAAVALQVALNERQVSLVGTEKIPAAFEAVLGPIQARTDLPREGLVVVVDCAELHRTGFETQLKRRPRGQKLLVIDHHRQGNLKHYADFFWQEQKATSTTQLIAEIVTVLRLPMSGRLATALLLGLYTDSGGFQHANTTSEALHLAANLIRRGANLKLITEALSARRTLNQTWLWGHALKELTVSQAGLAITRIGRQLIARTGSSAPDVAGLANLLCLADGVKAALVLVEGENGWRGILRSRTRFFHVGALAKLLGGNGSRSAGGFLVTDGAINANILDAI